MPLDSSQLWTLTPATTRLLAIRDDVDTALGLTLDYDRTLDGAYTTATALAAYRVDQGVQLAVSSMLIGSAPPQGVVARARQAGLAPKPAVAEQVLLTVAGAGELRETGKIYDDDGQSYTLDALYELVGSALTPAAWVDGAYDATSTTRILATATTAAEITPPASYALVPSVSGVTVSLASAGDLIRRGRDAETTAQLRSRVAESDAEPSGSLAGLRAALLNVPGVTGISITRTAGATLEVGLTYTGGLVDLDLFASTLYRYAPATATLTGSSSVIVEGVDGRDVTVYYTEESPQSVAVVAIVETDGSTTDADTIAAVKVAIDAVFARLDPGQTLLRLQIQGAIAGVPGVEGLTLTLDGGSGDITPATATTSLAAVQAVTVAP